MLSKTMCFVSDLLQKSLPTFLNYTVITDSSMKLCLNDENTNDWEITEGNLKLSTYRTFRTFIQGVFWFFKDLDFLVRLT